MGAMKATAEKASTTASATPAQASKQPFFSRAGEGNFFPRVQTKMSVGKVGDKFEQEADKTADKVMRMATPSGTDKVQRQADDKIQKREEEKILRVAAPDDKIQKAPAEEPKIQRREEEKILRAAMPDDKVQKAEEPKVQKAEEPKVQKAEEPKIQKAEEPNVQKAVAPHRAEEKILRAPDDKLQKSEEPKLQKAEEPKLQKAAVGDEKLQRDAAPGGGTPAVAGHVQSAIHSKMTGGEPLAADVRSYMEPRFNADFSNVRVHHDKEAGSLSNQLGARAFTYQNHVFFSQGQYQPGSSDGKHLLAHELTHTIQQGHAVQRSPQISSAPATPAIQRLGVQDALDKFAEWAYAIPGFRLLTLILGFNPINMRSADRTAANILRGLIELMPGGSFVTQALDNHGIINKAASWVESKLGQLGDIGSGLKQALKDFLDSLSWKDIFDLGGVWERAKRIFDDPITQLKNFALTTLAELAKMIKDALLKPLAIMAQGTNGYDLLCVILGEDPISGEAKPPTAENLLGGFMKLIGQEEIWKNIVAGRAKDRAFAWFKNALSGLMGIVRAIPQKIIAMLQSLTIEDIVTVAGAFGKIVGTFANIAGDFLSWGLSTIWDLLKIIFDVVKPGLMGYIQKTGGALKDILQNPMPFLSNLVAAAKLGFTNFAGNFATHLKTGMIDWLTGSLQGVYIPKALSLSELGQFAISVLGISWAQIRGKFVAAIGPRGEQIMHGLEVAFDVIKKVKDGGLAALWDMIKEKLNDLKDQVVSGIVSFVKDTIVQKAIPKLIGMFIPGAGFIPAIISIYDTIMVFVNKISKIIQVVTGFIDSIVAIAGGNIGGAAKRVEGALANGLSLAISFLAGFLGLSKVTDKIMEVVGKVRAKVDAAIEKAINWIVAKAKALFARLFGGKDKGKPDERTPEQKQADLNASMSAANALLAAPDATDTSIRNGLQGIKSKYKMSSLELVVDTDGELTETAHIEGKVNPESKGSASRIQKDGTVGPLGIVRSMLSWAAGTLKALLKDKAWNKFKNLRGQYAEAGLAIRHKVSISDTIKNTDNAIAPKKPDAAADMLAAKGFPVEGKPKTKPKIVASARDFLQAANNDLNNLFVGDAYINSVIVKEQYDPGDKGDRNADEHTEHRENFVEQWGFKDEEFVITMLRKSKSLKQNLTTEKIKSKGTKDVAPTT